MYFIDNIIIDQMSFEATTHDHCIYKKVIDESLVYLLSQINKCAIGYCDQKGTKMRFKD